MENFGGMMIHKGARSSGKLLAGDTSEPMVGPLV